MKANDYGNAIMSLIVSIGLFTTIMVGTTKFVFSSTRNSYDLENRIDNTGNIEKAFKLITSEIKMLGSSMPIGQSNFSPEDLSLGDASLAVHTNSNAGILSFNINETGKSTILTSSFTPGLGNLSFQVDDASDIFENENIYISDFTTGGNNGLRGSVSGVSGNTVTIAGIFETQLGTSFATGSLVTRSMEVEYRNSDGAIVREDTAGTVILAPRATISFAYFDSNGNALSVPLSRAAINNSLSAIRVTITATADNVERNGIARTITLTRTISLRNLILSRY